MVVKDLHILPKFRDGWSYLYVEHCRIDQDNQAIAINDASGKVPVPCANLALLMLGPGVSITHSAVSVLAEHGCVVAWCGEQGIRLYAIGIGETRSASNLYHQARMWADPQAHMQVVRLLYQLRFSEKFDSKLTLKQIRGMEGIRVREAYNKASKDTGVPWSGRIYLRNNWDNTDPINRSLSVANSCLYGICHAAIVSAGFSPALGFIHTGKMLSFVYDIADLYKTDIAIPVAFQVVAESIENIERRVRLKCRDTFIATRLLERIIPDIQTVLMMPELHSHIQEETFDVDPASPSFLWDPLEGKIEGGHIHSLKNKEGEEDFGSPDS